jgi:hypothetical protein
MLWNQFHGLSMTNSRWMIIISEFIAFQIWYYTSVIPQSCLFEVCQPPFGYPVYLLFELTHSDDFFLPSVRKSHGRACQARNPPQEVKPDPMSWSHFPYFLHSFLLLTFNWVATRVLSEDDQQPTLGIVIRIMQTLAWIKSNWTEQHELIRDKVVKRSHRVDSSGINPKCTKRMSLSWAIKLQIFDRQIALSSCKPIFLRNDQANLTHKRLSRSYKESKVWCESDPRSDWK